MLVTFPPAAADDDDNVELLLDFLAKVKASRTLTLEQPPRVLTLHLKQFSFHPKLGPRKLARRVRCDR